MTASLLRTKHSHYYYNEVLGDGRIITAISTIPNQIVGSDSRTNIGVVPFEPETPLRENNRWSSSKEPHSSLPWYQSFVRAICEPLNPTQLTMNILLVLQHIWLSLEH